MNQLSSITPLEIILIGSAAVGVFLFFRACWRNIKRSRHLGLALLTLMMSLTAQTAWAADITQNKAVVINSGNKATYHNKSIAGTVPADSYAGKSGSFISLGAVVVDGIELNLTIDGFNVDYTVRTTPVSGISLVNGAKLHLTIKGENTLTAGFGGAGIAVPAGCSLEITAVSDGTLHATGGKSYGGGAGIGSIGNRNNTNQGSNLLFPQGLGTITINGGTIYAKGGTWYSINKAAGGAAGIGSSELSGATTTDSSWGGTTYINNITGSITINGGTVTATGGYGAAGIGGGNAGTLQAITITDGTVTATPGKGAAAIGIGFNGFASGSGTLTIPAVSITGGTVKANGSIGFGEAIDDSQTLGASGSPIYRITYKLDGSTNADSNPEFYEKSVGVASLADPSGKDDYSFEGWYDNANFEGSPITSIAANETGAITLYAKWTQFRFAINYVLDHGHNASANPSTYDNRVGVESFATPTRTGYDFGGWYDNDGFNGSPITSIPANSAGDKTLYAKWTAHRYNISYEPNEGTMPSKYTTSYTVRTVTFNLPTPSREGYYFRGWYTDEDFASDKYTQIKYGTHQDFAFYAKWEKYAENGDGSRWNPWKIKDEADLRKLAEDVSNGARLEGKYFTQTADIEIKEGDWTPIGSGSISFRGTYDGDGHTISGVKINSESRGQGLFGHISLGGFVQNITLINSNITGRHFVGGIVGQLCQGVVRNCHVLSSVTVNGNSSSGQYIGGVAGSNEGGTITGCTSMAKVATGSDRYIGGIAGRVTSYKDVNSNKTYAPTVTNCFSYGKKPCGSGMSSTITNVKQVFKVQNTDGNVTLPDEVDANDGFYYDGIGYYKEGVSIPLTVTPAPVGYDIVVKQGNTTLAPDENGDYYFTTDNMSATISATSHLSPLLGYTATNTPDGSTDNPYIINSTDGWNLMSDCLQDNTTWNGFSGKTIKQDADIEVTRMAGTSGHEFKGAFNGAGHTLTVSYGTEGSPISEEYAAPFRFVDGATIQNLHVEGSIISTVRRAAGVIGETGDNTSHITNCVSSSTIRGGNFTGGFSIGGNVEIDGCVYNGKINGSGNSGGFVGYSQPTLKITNCLFAPQSGSSIGGGTFYYNGGGNITPVNSYYTQKLGTAQGKLAYVLPDASELLGNGNGEGIVKTYDTYGLGFDNMYYLNTIPLSETEGVIYLTDYLQALEVPVVFKRTFSAGKASTICLPFAMDDVSGGKVYSFAGITYDEKDGWVATMSETEAGGNNVTSTEANKPYVFMPDADGEVTFSGTTEKIPAAYDAKELSTVSGDWTFQGTYEQLKYGSNLDGHVYGFASRDKEVDGVNVAAGEFVKAKDGAGVKPMRCYLTYKDNQEFAGARAVTRGIEENLPQSITVKFVSSTGNTTAIATLNTQTGEITTDDAWYTLSGRKLNGKPSQRGVYINKGRKVAINR